METANDYTKRNFVFRLHAPDGSEFLFGADSEEQQEEWVRQRLMEIFFFFFSNELSFFDKVVMRFYFSTKLFQFVVSYQTFGEPPSLFDI